MDGLEEFWGAGGVESLLVDSEKLGELVLEGVGECDFGFGWHFN